MFRLHTGLFLFEQIDVIERKVFDDGVIGYRSGHGRKPIMSVWCYRIGEMLIDTGTIKEEDKLLECIRADGPVKRVYVTHHHEDHSGNMTGLIREFNPEVVISRYAAPLVRQGFRQYLYQKMIWGRFRPFEPDIVLDLPARGYLKWDNPDGEFEIHHCPGHSHDMTVLWDPVRRALFSADLYLGRQIRFMRRDEIWSESKESLQRIADLLPVRHLYCGHHPVTENGRAVLQAKLNWMQEFETHIMNKTAKAPYGQLNSEAWDVRLFTLGDASEKNIRRSVQGQFKIREDIIRRVGYRQAACDFEE